MAKDDQGLFRNRYQVIPRTLIFITKEDQVLLLKGAPTKRLWPNRYNGIGGHVERGEDVLSAARRELQEEAGLAVERVWLCGTLMVDTGENIGIGIYIFKGEYAGGELKPSEEGTLEWVALDDVPRLPAVEDLFVMLRKVMQWRPDQPAFSARSYYDEDDKLIQEFS